MTLSAPRPPLRLPLWQRAASLGRLLALCATVGWGAATGSAALAQNAPYDTLQRLNQANQLPQELQQADAWLADHPKDPQARFMKGVILSRQGRTDEAVTTFTELTRDYPELPEPHNNLAVLHAAAGRLGHAREALETAIRLNPAYGVAHQNLGDVYLRLAAQAYRTSLGLAPDTPGLAQRLQRLEAIPAATAP